MKLTDEMIIETCKKLANGEYESHHEVGRHFAGMACVIAGLYGF